jgi:hypothetical protein
MSLFSPGERKAEIRVWHVTSVYLPQLVSKVVHATLPIVSVAIEDLHAYSDCQWPRGRSHWKGKNVALLTEKGI